MISIKALKTNLLYTLSIDGKIISTPKNSVTKTIIEKMTSKKLPFANSDDSKEGRLIGNLRFLIYGNSYGNLEEGKTISLTDEQIYKYINTISDVESLLEEIWNQKEPK